MRDLRTALHMPDLELSDLTSITPLILGTQAKNISNPFWKSVLGSLQNYTESYVTSLGREKSLIEHVIWDSNLLLTKSGAPHDKRHFQKAATECLKTVGNGVRYDIIHKTGKETSRLDEIINVWPNPICHEQALSLVKVVSP